MWRVDKKLAMQMSMTLKYKGNKIISYSKCTWWITGFNPDPKYLDVKAKDLKASFGVVFKRKQMYSDFKNKYGKKWICNDKTKKVSYSF